MLTASSFLPSSSVASTWTDRLGIWASALCVVHCLFTPVLLSLSAVAVHLLPSEEHTHRVLAVLVALLGLFALLSGFRRHRRVLVLALVGVGLGCIAFAAFAADLLPSHTAEVALTFTGSLFMITAHRLNHTFCRQGTCACA